MAASIIDRVFIYQNGSLNGYADSATIKWQGSPQAVSTLVRDLAGFYVVPKNTLISVEQFAAADGTSFNPSQPFMGNEIITIKGQLGGTGESIEVEGMIQEPSIVSTPTNPTKWSFDVLAEAKPLE